MLCSFVEEGTQTCPFGCKKKWIMCHDFFQNECRHEQWNWCKKGWHTSEESLKAQREYATKAFWPKPSGQRDSETSNARKSRSRSIDHRENRIPAEQPRRDAPTNPCRCQKWALDPEIQMAMVALRIYSYVLPDQRQVDEAFTRAMRTAPSEEASSKAKFAFERLRNAISTHTQTASSSGDPPPPARSVR